MNHSPRQPQHQIIYQDIYDSILSGKYAYGDRLPTDGALVRKYDVSRPTVARAMRDLEQKGIGDPGIGPREDEHSKSEGKCPEGA